mgnify:CR=1 FL=1
MGGDDNLRKKYERSTVPIGRVLAKLGITPNMMTSLSIVVSFVSLYFFLYKQLLYAFIVIVIAGALDILDGAIARATGKASRFGTLLDNTADRIVEGVIILGLVIGQFIYGWIGVFTLLAMFLPSYIRARGEAELGVNARGVGIFERKEKLGLLFGGIILTIMKVEYTVEILGIQLNILNIVCIAVIVGSLISSLQRLIFFRNVTSKTVSEQAT